MTRQIQNYNYTSRGTRTLHISLFLLCVFVAVPCRSQQRAENVQIHVRFDQSEGPLTPVWDYFGYDEPNYTYAPNGRKLLGEIAALNSVPAHVRVHNLFTTGGGSASLKWGSTNVYTEDASGKPVYNWDILDQIFDEFYHAGIKPLVEIGFMPEVLSTHPTPYRHSFPQHSAAGLFTGWAYPPKDYRKWSELVYEFVRHLRSRYGDAETKSWLWEVWNEPDIGYWQGSRDEYFKLYDFTVDSVLRALPEAKVGGPDTTGPGSSKSADFLHAFLEHCAHGKNYANGQTGSHLDFISFHPKGSPHWEGDHVQMGISHQLAVIQQGFRIVASFPEWRATPVILGESDPEGCAACSAKENPQNQYRNGPLYGAYTLEVLNNTVALARRDQINLVGAVTWAFEFENQPPFAGFRELATNGIDKPVLNAFRMLGLLGDERVQLTNSAALRNQDIVQSGVRGKPDITAIAARKEHEIQVLVWNYHDDDVPVPAATIDLIISGLPAEIKRGLLENFQVDSNHSNAFSAWRAMGSPESLSAQQFEQLENEGQLQLLTSPAWVDVAKGEFNTKITLPRQAYSLLRLSW